MSIRVGRILYDSQGKPTQPNYPGYAPIVCMTKSSAYGSLSPYELRDSEKRNLECLWQMAKVYKRVPKTISKYSRYDSRVIWDHPAETHVVESREVLDGNKKAHKEVVVNEAYWNWRAKGMSAPDAIRYPVGYNARHSCLGAIWDEKVHLQHPEARLEGPITLLDYITARKRIYLTLYSRMVRDKPQFLALRKKLAQGENLLLLEVDGPHQESLKYYVDKYGVSTDFIQAGSVAATLENLELLLNDPKHPFGHGYALAWSLYDYPVP